MTLIATAPAAGQPEKTGSARSCVQPVGPSSCRVLTDASQLDPAHYAEFWIDEKGLGVITTYPTLDEWNVIPAHDDRIIAFHTPEAGWMFYHQREPIDEPEARLACAAIGITDVSVRG